MTRDPSNEGASESTLGRRARERVADRLAGRPERGLFTGRGRQVEPSHDELDGDLDEELDDLDGEFDQRVQGSPRTGAKRTVLGAIRQLPAYVRLLFGLMRDSRVSRVDRFFVLAAAAYIISPLDLIPDLIPLLGQADDVFLLVLALQRLLDNTGRRVLLDHWNGDPADLSGVNLEAIVGAAAFFLPGRIKKRLRGFARR